MVARRGQDERCHTGNRPGRSNALRYQREHDSSQLTPLAPTPPPPVTHPINGTSRSRAVGRNRERRRAVGLGMASGHKITIAPADAHAEVRLGDQTVAESDRAIRPDETGLPGRDYITPEKVLTGTPD